MTVVTKPYPGLRTVRNPVAVGGGADPDAPDQIRENAPRSVLTFGRAISGDDYEALAATTPGVTRARAYWRWSDQEQRTLVMVYVGDDQSAVSAAKIALAGAVDPNRPVLVSLATAIRIALTLTLELNSRVVPADVVAAVTAALLTDEHALFAQRQIGRPLYESEIYAACLSIAGTTAVHGLSVSVDRGSGLTDETNWRYVPGEGAFFTLAAADLTIGYEQE